MRIESGNPRARRRWGTMIGAGIKQRRRKTIAAPRQRRRRSNRCYPRRRQRGRGLFSGIGSKTVDRAFQNLEGIAPGLISRAAAELLFFSFFYQLNRTNNSRERNNR